MVFVRADLNVRLGGWGCWGCRARLCGLGQLPCCQHCSPQPSLGGSAQRVACRMAAAPQSRLRWRSCVQPFRPPRRVCGHRLCPPPPALVTASICLCSCPPPSPQVPLDGDLNITDDTRIRAAVPTLKYLLDNGAKVGAAHWCMPCGCWPPCCRVLVGAARLPRGCWPPRCWVLRACHAGAGPPLLPGACGCCAPCCRVLHTRCWVLRPLLLGLALGPGLSDCIIRGSVGRAHPWPARSPFLGRLHASATARAR